MTLWNAYFVYTLKPTGRIDYSNKNKLIGRSILNLWKQARD